MLAEKGRNATKEFQYYRKGVLVLCSSSYLSSRWLGMFVGKIVDGVWPVVESVGGSKNVSGNDENVSEESSSGSFTRLGTPWENVWVIQCGRCWDEVGGFSRICSELGV